MEGTAGDIRSFAAIGVHESAQHVEGSLQCRLCGKADLFGAYR
jgi:hypothetical protein